MNEEIQKLELRITELENKLKTSQQGAQANIDPEDLKTYHKVSQQLGISGCINECQPSVPISVCYHCIVCHICHVCYRCINECICGPCVACYGSGGGLGGGRFGSLG
jgi:hypothetical protein